MGSICILLLCLALLRSFNGLSVSAEPYQELEKDCSVYAHQVTKPMLGYFQQVTQKIEKHSAEIQSKNDLIQQLKENEINLQRQIRQLEKNVMNLETQSTIYKSKEDSMTVVLEEMRKHFEQLPNNLCQKQYDEIEKLKTNISSVGTILKKCETELISNKNAIVEKDRTIQKQEGEIKNFNLKIEIEPKSCISSVKSGVKSVTLPKGYNFEVLCNSDIVGPGWTVIQQRIRGRVDFYRDWNTYRNGFGDFWDGDFFLGLEKIHRLTTELPHELYIHMERFNGSTYYASYDEFAISGEEDQYRLTTLGTFSGKTVNKFENNKNNGFTTYDRDNDLNAYLNDAILFHSGWWYAMLAHCNLNGIYYETEKVSHHAIYWEEHTALKQVKMMIRPKQALK